MIHTIKFYPVGTADCTLIKLNSGRTIIIDTQIKNPYDNNGNQVCYDVKKDLLNELKKDSDGHPFVDLFISTHPHDDHCVGFEENFYHGLPSDYVDENNLDQIIVGELWITSYGMKNDVCDSAAAIRREAKRRRALYDSDKEFNGEYGSYLRVIGYDKDKEYDSRYGYIPGTCVHVINGCKLSSLELFIHAPFKDDIADAKEVKDKNATSIVVQFAFFIKGIEGIAGRVLIGGDAEHQIWEHILDKNDDDERLKWNIFLTPHHCSWTFFNETSDKEHVLQSAEDILEKQIGKDSYIIASSKEIKDEKPDPPHYEAMCEYKKRLKNKSNFLNTETQYVVNGIPQPIIIKVSEAGVQDKSRQIDEGEAKSFARALKEGSLKIDKTATLSLTTGRAIAASKGFYGEE